jgi:acetoin utilization deacetylase AcuC-like enzyme
LPKRKAIHRSSRCAVHLGITLRARVAAGYCYLNNAAIAAQAFTNDGAKRVAVLDVDYHHGNGTQDIFYDRDDVLFVSIHADPAFEYPSFCGYAAAASGSQLSVVAGTRNQRYLHLDHAVL